MKKLLIALAALAAVGTASAQSSVTLSGIIKGGIAVTEYTNGPIGTRTNGSGWSVQDGSSRFILSGVEDLGGGLKGLFQIDTRFRVDDNGAARLSASARWLPATPSSASAARSARSRSASATRTIAWVRTRTVAWPPR